MDVPAGLALFGTAAGAALGFAAGRLTRPAERPAVDAEAVADLLEAAYARLDGERFALVLRVDAVGTWRRTHGAAALDLFVRRLEEAVHAELPDAADVRTGEAEVTAVCPGRPERAGGLLGALKARRFRLPSGAETLVTCSLGLAPAEGGATLAELRSRANAAVRAAQDAGRWRAMVADGSGTRAL